MSVELSDFHLALLYILGPIAAGGVGVFFKCKLAQIDKIDKRSFRQSKGLLNMAAKLDELKMHLHPNEPNPKFFNQMQRDLTDSKGNL